jgi:hypothetical protein
LEHGVTCKGDADVTDEALILDEEDPDVTDIQEELSESSHQAIKSLMQPVSISKKLVTRRY